MDKRFIKELAGASYDKNGLDAAKVEKIASHLSKKELKEYVKQLRIQQKLLTIYVEVPQLDSAYEKQLQEVFPDKKIEITVNPDLLLGMRIQNNDDIFELSLKNTLESLGAHITG
jgi:hypothetical protein